MQNLELDDTQFIRKGFNGYLPLVSFDSFRRPVFVDPVTFSEISQFIFLKKDCIDLVLCLQYKLSLCFVLYNEIKQNIYVL